MQPSIESIFSSAQQYTDAHMANSSGWRKVIGKKIVFQTILDKFDSYVFRNEERQQILARSMYMGCHQPMAIYRHILAEILASASRDEFSPRGIVALEKLVAMIDEAMPYAHWLDKARVTLYPGLMDSVREGDERRFRQIIEIADEQGAASSSGGKSKTSTGKRVDAELAVLSENCERQLKALEPGNYACIPSGTPGHEEKVLIRKNDDGTFDVHFPYGDEDPSYRLTERELNADFIAGIFKRKIYNKEMKIKGKTKLESIHEACWGHKRFQGYYSNSCSVKSFQALIKALFYVHFEGDELGKADYKLLTSLIDDGLLAQYGSQLDPTTAFYAQLKSDIRRRYRDWRPAVLDGEEFARAVDGYRKMLYMLEGETASAFIATVDYLENKDVDNPGQKLKLLQKLHERLVHALKLENSKSSSSSSSSSSTSNSNGVMASAFAAAALENCMLESRARRLGDLFEQEKSVAGWMKRSLMNLMPFMDYIIPEDEEYLVSTHGIIIDYVKNYLRDVENGTLPMPLEQFVEEISSPKMAHLNNQDETLGLLQMIAVIEGNERVIQSLNRKNPLSEKSKNSILGNAIRRCLERGSYQKWNRELFQLFCDRAAQNPPSIGSISHPSLIDVLNIGKSENSSLYHTNYSHLIDTLHTFMERYAYEIFNNETFIEIIGNYIFLNRDVGLELKRSYADHLLKNVAADSKAHIEGLFVLLNHGWDSPCQMMMREKIPALMDVEGMFNNSVFIDQMIRKLNYFSKECQMRFISGLAEKFSVMDHQIVMTRLLSLTHNRLYEKPVQDMLSSIMDDYSRLHRGP